MSNKLRESQERENTLSKSIQKLQDENTKLRNENEYLKRRLNNPNSNAMQNTLDFNHINYHEPKV